MKENSVRLIGFLPEPPKVYAEAGNPENIAEARINVLTIRRSYVADDYAIKKGQYRFDRPLVRTRNKEIIQDKILDSGLEQWDFVIIKGNLCTKEVRRRTVCEKCNHINIKEGAVGVYVDPIYLEKLENEQNEYIKIFRYHVKERLSVLEGHLEKGRDIPSDEVTKVMDVIFLLSELEEEIARTVAVKKKRMEYKPFCVLEEGLKKESIVSKPFRTDLKNIILHMENYRKALKENRNLEFYLETFKKDDKVLEKHAFNILKKHYEEISNEVQILGHVCNMEEFYLNEETQKKEFDYQVAINRSRRIPEDGPDKKTDYPWIKTFHGMAEECSKVLNISSKLYINGALQTRVPKQLFFCENCGHVYEKEIEVMEVVPYSNEYLGNCDIPERQVTEDLEVEYEISNREGAY